MNIHFDYSPTSARTGRWLTTLLRQAIPDLQINNPVAAFDACILYGGEMHLPQIPTLNANCREMSKLGQLRTFITAGIPTLNYCPATRILPTIPYPMVARSRHHTQGKDIIMVHNATEYTRARQCRDFFTEWITAPHELRTWVYRSRHLGTYIKKLTHPTWSKSPIRNYRNGWGYLIQPAAENPPFAIDIARKAVAACNYDFGAVDLIGNLAEPQSWRVLEVNTAPGVESMERFALQNLAQKMTNWINNGFPRRRGTPAV